MRKKIPFILSLEHSKHIRPAFFKKLQLPKTNWIIMCTIISTINIDRYDPERHPIPSMVWPVSRWFGKFPDGLGSFHMIWKIFGWSKKMVWKFSEWSGKFPDGLASFQMVL